MRCLLECNQIADCAESVLGPNVKFLCASVKFSFFTPLLCLPYLVCHKTVDATWLCRRKYRNASSSVDIWKVSRWEREPFTCRTTSTKYFRFILPLPTTTTTTIGMSNGGLGNLPNTFQIKTHLLGGRHKIPGRKKKGLSLCSKSIKQRFTTRRPAGDE